MQLTIRNMCSLFILSLSVGLVSCTPDSTKALATMPELKPAEHISEAERRIRIQHDFQWSEDQVKAELAQLIPDFTDADFNRWHAQGLLEFQQIDGEIRYFNRAVSNLFYLDANARDRRIEPKHWYYDTLPLYQVHPHHQAVLTGNDLQKRIRVQYTLTVKPDVIPEGQTLRVWIPFPREIPGQQTDITLIDAQPLQPVIAENTQMQRTAYFEQTTQAGQATTFTLNYEYTAHAIHHAIDVNRVRPLANPIKLQPYLSERRPHIVFTDTLREFSARVVGDETNPYRIAQKLFAAVDDIPWASAREYSSIANISEYAATAGHADCGQQTLLLMTLMRMNNIPTRWQSGWEFSDGSFSTMHDWGWFYLEPYGWMPMDVTHGQLNSVEESLQWFYLGSLDAYRLVFNDDYSQPFYPPKNHTRSETVDSQRGEVEWEFGNLYFDNWQYNMKWDVVDD